jgi:hypothetical protein
VSVVSEVFAHMHELTYDIILMAGRNGRSAEGCINSTSYINRRASPPPFMYSLSGSLRSASSHFRSFSSACTAIPTAYHLPASPFNPTSRLEPGLPFVRFTTSSYNRSTMTDTNQGGDSSKKTYHKKATGNALTTVKNHTKEEDLKLYGSCFWYVTFTLHQLHYPYINNYKPLCPTCLDILGT